MKGSFIGAVLTLFAVVALGSPGTPAQSPSPRPVQFVEAEDAAGLHFHFRNSATPNKYLIETMGGGVAILDYDNDGWPDVFFVNGAALKTPQPDREPPDKSSPECWNRLFRNNHDGTFTDVTERAGVKGKGYGMGAAVGDYDNDGYPDLLVTNFGECILYHNNGNGTFTDVTARSGIRTEGWNMSAGFLDYDNDGFLDLVVTRYLDWNFSIGARVCGVSRPGGRAYCHPNEFKPGSNYLFHNNGDGTFTDVSQSSHIAASKGYGLGLAFGDYNNDGWLDIYVANDSSPQFLFKNNGDGTFTETAALAGVAYTEDGSTFSGMGTDFADLDNDGLPDIVTTALPYEYFALFHNDGGGLFSYASVTSNLAELSRPYSGWGIHVFDCDNDGENEVFIATGHVMDNIEVTQPHLHYLEKPLLLKFQGGRFIDISAEAGEAFTHAWAARGAAFGDFENNGRTDIVVSDYTGPAHLLRNEGGMQHHWIELDLQGTRSNRDAVGARVKLTSAGGKVQYRTVSTAGSYASANDRRILFGLGEEKAIRQIAIRWPSGVEQAVDNPKPDEILHILEPSFNPRRQPLKTGTGEISAADHILRAAQHTSGQTRYDAGLALLRRGKIREAAAEFRKAILLKPDFVEAHYALGVALSRLGSGSFPAAVDQFLEVLRLRPDNIDARVDLSSMLAAEGDNAAAAAQLEEASRLAPSNADLYILLGKAQLNLSQFSEASASFRRASELKPRLSAAHYGLGLASARQGDAARAIQEQLRALDLNPDDPFCHLELGKIYFAKGNLPEAARHLNETVRLRPDMAQAYMELGKLYRREGILEKAEAAYRKALELQPGSSEANYGMASLLRSEGKSEESRPFFAKSEAQRQAQARTGNANALNADGIQCTNEGRLDEALGDFGKALAADPAFFMAAYNQGIVLGRLGRRQEAMAAFRTAIRLRPDFVLGHYALGFLLKSAGDPAAEEELAKAKLLHEYVAQPLGRDALESKAAN